MDGHQHPVLVEYGKLQKRYEEAREATEMSLELLDEAIAEKMKEILLLGESKVAMLEEQRTIREKHSERMDLVDSKCAKKYLELSQVEEELHPFPDRESSRHEEELSSARDELKRVQSENAAEIFKLKEEFKGDELRWMLKMVQAGEVDSNDRNAMFEATQKRFADLQREHGEMREELAVRGRHVAQILAENKKLAEQQVSMRLELSSLTEMNSISHEKLYCLTQASLRGAEEEPSMMTDTTAPSPPSSSKKLFSRRRRPDSAGRHVVDQAKAEERVDDCPQFLSFNAALPDFSLLSNMLDLHLAHRAKATCAFLDSARQYAAEIVDNVEDDGKGGGEVSQGESDSHVAEDQ